jgi:hypothetical protein
MKYKHLHGLLRRLETVLKPSAHKFTLNSGEVAFLSWEKFQDGVSDVLAGRDTHEAFVVKSTVETGDEWTAKNVEMLRAIMSPIDTDDPVALASWRATQRTGGTR